jgi:manganese transport protein
VYLSRTEAATLSSRPVGSRRGRVPRSSWRLWPLLGPAFVAAIAYVDPGNFATNSSAGASLGYRLLWVVVAANGLAMLVQVLTAKLGLATGRDLASLCRETLPRPVTWGLWLQAEGVAIATDLAEIIGGAVGLQLLFGVPLPVGGLLTAAVAFLLLSAQSRGHRPFERVIGGLLLIIALGLGYTLAGAGLDPAALGSGLVVSLDGGNALLLAVGILGATVMPHAVYVHSALTPGRYGDALDAGRSAAGRGRLLRAQRVDVVLAMGLAGLVNAAMLVVAAQLFADTGAGGRPTLQDVHAGLAEHSGRGAGLAFAVALLASGLAASSVGTHAGQVVMAGFLRRTLPVTLRRALTVAPALVLLAAGADPTTALVWSQVALSFGLPFALVPLLWLTGRRSVMGAWVNRPATTAAGAAVTTLVLGLNGYLVIATFG